jgi:hypothetical protein
MCTAHVARRQLKEAHSCSSQGLVACQGSWHEADWVCFFLHLKCIAAREYPAAIASWKVEVLDTPDTEASSAAQQTEPSAASTSVSAPSAHAPPHEAPLSSGQHLFGLRWQRLSADEAQTTLQACTNFATVWCVSGAQVSLLIFCVPTLAEGNHGALQRFPCKSLRRNLIATSSSA